VPRRSKFDPEKIRASMNVTCLLCGASIPPDQQMRIDFERMKCTKCAKTL
jgi:ribosomal protein S27E